MANLKITWTDFKALVDSGTMQWKFNELSDRYDLFGYEGLAAYSLSILKENPAGTDQQDFETNYKSNPSSEVVLPIKAWIAPDQVINAVPSIYTSKLRYDILTPDQAVSDSIYTTIYNYTGSGRFFGFSLQFSYPGVSIKFSIDEELIIDGIDLDALNIDRLISINLLSRPEDRTLKINLNEGIKYSSSIQIKVKSDTPGKKMTYGYTLLTKES